MPKMVIVDDESIFRKGIAHLVQGFDLDWEVVGEARDGLEALEQVQRLQPDLVITDIRMPRMNGLELQTALAKKAPGTRCIVLSGYNDFKYVQSSIRTGARDYLLKPINKAELYQTLERLLDEWRQNRRAANKDNALFKRSMRSQLLLGLVQGSVQLGDTEVLEHVGLKLDNSGLYCMIAELDKESVQEERYRRSDPGLFTLYLSQFIEEMIRLHFHGYVFNQQNKIVAVICEETSEQAKARIAAAARSMIREIRNISDITITAGIGNGVADLESLPTAYQQAELALLYRLTDGGNRVLMYDEAAANKLVWQATQDWDISELMITEGSAAGLRQEVQRLVEELSQSGSPELLRQHICKFLLQCYEMAVNRGVVQAWLGKRDIKKVLEEALSITSRVDITCYCEELVLSLSAILQQQGRDHITHAVDKVVAYIETHYAEPITLSMMADKVYLNASYLSSLFKARLGCSFVEVLTRRRIREACRRLAHSSEKIVQIAERTGFANIRHFNRVFKTETGRTPKQYREEMRAASMP
ncbi:response regulator [Paenibacillus sp. P96]|uniref:Response regulator n=1 Tax=Paenibacillus zeirhizosphaerae TaxID=2987519 RepID=A0ABT9FU28_9BACL|nr:response regulator [Paenibacillus sp. P96]MDP4098205.1 response regulator [Paenibacillus sp. P96]